MSTTINQRGAALRHAQRVAGQASALPSMIVGAQPFAAVAQQILAARGSLDSLLLRLVELELARCVSDPADRREIDGLLHSALGRVGYRRHAAPSRAPERSGKGAAPVNLEGRTSS